MPYALAHASGYLSISAANSITFDESWQVEKYDEHADYHKLLQQVDGTKAVDFIATRTTGPKVLYLIEVKDFRGYRTEQKQELTSGELASEIVQKVRDTLPGLIGGCRTSSKQDAWRPFASGLLDLQTEIRVIVWLESESRSPYPDDKAKSTLIEQLKRKLRWLTTKVAVLSLKQGPPPDGLHVISLPRIEPETN